MKHALLGCGAVLVLPALLGGCEGHEPPMDAGPETGPRYETCCLDNRYDLCLCLSENCDGPFIANCGGGVCANFFPMTPMTDPCEGVE